MSDIILGQPFKRYGPSETLTLFNQATWVHSETVTNGEPVLVLNGFTIYFEPLFKEMPEKKDATPFSLHLSCGDDSFVKHGFIPDHVAERILRSKEAPMSLRGLPNQSEKLYLTTCPDFTRNQLFLVTIKMVFLPEEGPTTGLVA